MSGPKPDPREKRLPPAVTFTSGAKLLVELRIVPSITREGIRHISTSDRYAETWPFGFGKPYPYGWAGKAALMATDPFLDFFRNVYVPGMNDPDEPEGDE